MAQGGVLKATEITPSGSMEAAYQADNGTGFAFIMNEASGSFLTVVNAMGGCAVYDVDGNDVTGSHDALVQEARTAAAANQPDVAEACQSKLQRMYEGAADINPVELNTFSTVVYAAGFRFENTDYTIFYCRPTGFDQMDVYVVLDTADAIAKVDAKQLFFDTD